MASRIPKAQTLFGLSRRVTAEGRVEELPGFAEGDWWVQDAAATLPALLLGDVAGKRVIDLCAAPGGKTLQLAARGARGDGGRDRCRARWRACAKIWRAPDLTANVIESDVRDFQRHRAAGAAGCALHRHRHHPPPSRPALDQGRRRCDGAAPRWPMICWKARAAMVEPGGLLVFAVCSLEREEGEEQIAAFPGRASGIRARAGRGGRMFRSWRMDHAGGRSAHPALSPGAIGRDGWLLCRAAQAAIAREPRRSTAMTSAL